MSFSKAPVIGVVVLNWNGAADTRACLDSLYESDPRPEYVVVVDNGSKDDSVRELLEWARIKQTKAQLHRDADLSTPTFSADWLTILLASRNLGFAGGNNVGLRYLLESRSVTHLMLLNNDAMVASDAFAQMREVLELRPDIGLLTGTIYEHPARDRVWYAGGREIRSRALIVHEHDVPADDTPVSTEFISGCLMLIARPVLARLGLLAECYFPLYHEDAEYSVRAREAGFDVVYAPRIVAFHKVGGAVGAASDSPFITRAQIRHRILYVRRNFRGADRVIALAYLAATKPGRSLLEAAKGHFSIAAAVLQGTFEGFKERTT
jgi:GT2 family glycosyltransferase